MDMQTLQGHKHDILGLAAKYGASNLRVFGSVARGDADDKSDIDLLLDLESGRSLMDLARLNVALEDLLHTSVDLVLSKNIKPALKDDILRDARDL